MFRKICVIGLGSLGSYLCKYLSELDQVQHLVLVDRDIVDIGNCYKSAFTKYQVGMKKVDAVGQMVYNGVKMTKLYTDYEEGKTKIPYADLVIDCRDEFCRRKKEIDIRMFISENHLVIDCEKARYCKRRQGHYLIDIPKERISTAAFFATRMIDSPDIQKMLTNQIIHMVDLKTLVPLGSDDIQLIIDNKEDMIYDHHEGSEKLLQLEENLLPIFNSNKSNDVEVFIGEEHPVKEFLDLQERPYYALVPKNTLTKPTDIIPILVKLTEGSDDMNFIVKCNVRGFKKHVYLIQESGSA